MAQSAAELPIRPQVVLRAVLANAAARMEQYPITALYRGGADVRLVPDSRFHVRTERETRTEGVLHAGVQEADRLERVQYGDLLVRIAFQYYKDLIPTNFLPVLAELALQPTGEVRADAVLARGAAQRWIDKIVQDYTLACFRTLEILCCKCLTAAAPSVSIDGVSTTVDTGLTVDTSTCGNWDTSTTDIPGDLGAMIQKHEDRCGQAPTHMVYSFQQTANFAKNEAIRAILNSGRIPFSPITALPMEVMPDDLRTATIIKHRGHYKNTAGSKAYFWPKGIVTLITQTTPKETLDMASVLTQLHLEQMAEQENPFSSMGFFTNVWKNPETKATWVGVGHNGAPINVNPENISVFDVTA